MATVELTNDEINCLVSLYVNQSIKNETSGSHYRLVGPFIIPSERQQLNVALIADRWVALSAFKQLYRPKTDQFSSASTSVTQVDEF